MPHRLREVAGPNLRMVAESGKWLIRSHEHTNWTYNLTPLNTRYLAWFVANNVGMPVTEVRSYIDELLADEKLSDHIAARTSESHRAGLADSEARYGRRLGWYAMVRAIKPDHVIETGTDKGLGSVVLAAALIKNGSGRLTTIDINPDSGYLVSGRWAEVTHKLVGDSERILRDSATAVDMFIHDSLHTVEHERSEYQAVWPRLSATSLVLSDNAEFEPTLMEWAEEHGWMFDYFQEEPLAHWYRGGGIGVAHPPPAPRPRNDARPD